MLVATTLSRLVATTLELVHEHAYTCTDNAPSRHGGLMQLFQYFQTVATTLELVHIQMDELTVCC